MHSIPCFINHILQPNVHPHVFVATHMHVVPRWDAQIQACYCLQLLRAMPQIVVSHSGFLVSQTYILKCTKLFATCLAMHCFLLDSDWSSCCSVVVSYLPMLTGANWECNQMIVNNYMNYSTILQRIPNETLAEHFSSPQWRHVLLDQSVDVPHIMV